MPPNPTPIAFQITVQRDWRAKLRDDARKIRNDLHLDRLMFISSRRIPPRSTEEAEDTSAVRTRPPIRKQKSHTKKDHLTIST
jgi:hypothetical protein